MKKELEHIKEEALRELAAVSEAEAVKALSIRYLGRKGLLTQCLRGIAGLPENERPEMGREANKIKSLLDEAFSETTKSLSSAQSTSGREIDVTLPGRPIERGGLHPISQINQQICDIFIRLGFDIAEGPEIETDYYNFEALNFPRHHPARDMQDTLYISELVVLRTHTSPIQVRTMEKRQPPLRIIAPGRVFRCDSDITHTPMFHQVEGLLVDRKVSFGDLKGMLTTFVHQMFDEKISLRFRPSFFPFTEPSAEVDILCVICRGKGCRVCSQTGWLEVLGSGMVHPRVFDYAGYDSSKYTGFAFGMGVERIAMLKYGIDDIRKFFENDLRFLRQFSS